MQKQNEETGKWETVLYDILAGRNYELFGYLSGVRYATISNPVLKEGLPDDFEVKSEGENKYHNDFYMGYHSFGHATLKEIIDTPLSEEYLTETENFAIAKEGHSIIIDLQPEEENYEARIVQEFRTSLVTFFGYNLHEYRLVVGYDS